MVNEHQLVIVVAIYQIYTQSNRQTLDMCVCRSPCWSDVYQTNTIDSKSQSITLTVKWTRMYNYMRTQVWWIHALFDDLHWTSVQKSNQITNNVHLDFECDKWRRCQMLDKGCKTKAKLFLASLKTRGANFQLKQLQPHLQCNDTCFLVFTFDFLFDFYSLLLYFFIIFSYRV